MGSDFKKQVVVFTLNGQKYAVPILSVREIINMVSITCIPKADYFVEGVINLRGSVIPVVNLGKLFNIDLKSNNSSSKIIVLDVTGRPLGIIVDEVNEVGEYSDAEFEAPDNNIKEGQILSGMIKKEEQIWLLLDLAKIENLQNI